MKRNRNKFILAIVLILALSITSAFAGNMGNFKKVQEYPDKFTDVRTTDWYFNDVVNAYESGLFIGRSEQEFAPDGNLTLGEAITLVSRVHNIYDDNNEQFKSSLFQKWYIPYVDYAIKNSLFIPGEFNDYDRNATRAELAYLFHNSVGKEELEKINNITKVPDVNDNVKYSYEIYTLFNAGVLAGNDKYGTFNPTTSIKRSEVAAILNRVVNKDNRLEVNLEIKSENQNPPVSSNLTEEQKQAIEDIKIALGKDTYDYKALRSDWEGEKLAAFDKDYEQLITDPYSSPDLTRYFDIYIKSGNIDYFVSSVGAWLMNGGDDGKANTKLD